MSEGLQAVTNYLIPPVGIPRCFVHTRTFSAVPDIVDFRTIAGGMIDAQPFRPCGLFIDNHLGVGALNVLIVEINYNVHVPAGETLNAQFPAVHNATYSITGDGAATVVFADFPVIPFRSF